MIRNENKIVVERSGDFDETSFGIDSEDVSLILEIIRNKLYTNKLGSFVREITSNAYDAMIEAAIARGETAEAVRNREILFTLPTVENKQTLTIRDFGTGMSDDKVKKIYTRVGKSTRSGSNNYVGMMGIGRLVGFCLTDSFNVISYLDGVRTEYLCYIDETKCGKVAMLSQVETKEANGVAISVNVPAEIHYELCQEIQNFTAFTTDVKFKFVNHSTNYYNPFHGADVSEYMKNVIFKGTNWVKYKDRVNDVGAYVKMGLVKYPLPNNMVSGAFFCDGTIVFEVPIGAVTVSASREGLEFTAQTKAYVEALFTKAKREASAEMFKEVEKAKDVKEALAMFKTHSGIWCSLDRPSVLWKNPLTGVDLDLADLCGKYYEMASPSYKIVLEDDGKTPKLDSNGNQVFFEIETKKWKFEYRCYELQSNRRNKQDGSSCLQFTNAFYRLVEDHEIESLPDIRRCRTLFNNNAVGTHWVYVFTKRGLKHFIDCVGFDPTVHMLKFDDVIEMILPRGHSVRPPVQIKKVVFGYDARTDKVEVERSELTEELDNLPPGYWVSRHYSRILYNRAMASEIDENELNTLFRTIALFLKQALTLYILPATGGRILDVEKQKDPTSTDFDNLTPVHAWIEGLFKNTKLLEYICNSTTDIEVHSWETQQVTKIFNSEFKAVRSPHTVQIIDLVKKAIRPHVPGQVKVDPKVIEKLKSFHSQEKLVIKKYSDALRDKAVELNEKYPLMPDDLCRIGSIIEFFKNISVYDEYLYSVTSDRAAREAANPSLQVKQ